MYIVHVKVHVGVRSLNVSKSLSVLCLVMFARSRFLGGLLVITRNLLVLSLCSISKEGNVIIFSMM